MSRLLALLILVALSLPVAGCGKKNPPEPPPGGETYPRTYPQ